MGILWFFTLIPHDFGMNKPPLLDNLDIIKEKVDMVSSLMDIELAFSILKSTEDDHKDDPLDVHYRKLKADIDVLERDSDQFKLLDTYLKNTHASTHSNYKLELEQVFCVKRKGEATRYKPFSKLPNKKLLWHGSRLANFAGILSQGLRIAPPEAPATGYMFGKGLYFADMVSKSANYCFASHGNPRGLLLLCEVALGNMYEKKSAEYVTKLPTGKHSTKGLGKTHPDPGQMHVTDSKVEIPLGKATSSKTTNTSLLYNEYIVYDVAQAHIQYLLQVNFKFQGF